MQITDQQLDDFIEIYQKNFGIVLDRQTASEKGLRLLNFLKFINSIEKIKKSNEEYTEKV